MEKINFENLPSTNTPLDADTLNGMQSNIEKSVVAIGKTQPSTSENVWIKKGKNLFNKNTIFRGYIETSSQKIVTAQDEFYSCYVKVNPNTIYTVSKQAGKSFRIATTNIVPTNGVTYTSTTANHTGTSITITTGANDNYICIFFYATSNGDTGGYENMANTIQVEQNSTATTYEPYIEKEILVKNNNGVFEKFLGEPKEIFKLVKTCTTGSSAHHGYYYVDLYMGNDGININNLIQINAKIGGNALFLYQWISDYEIRIRTNTPNTNVTIYLFYIV